jgi:hypothetical protein
VGYQGNVRKTATVVSNDPDEGEVRLAMSGTVNPWIDVKPLRTLYFRGMGNQMEPRTVEITSDSEAFRIEKVDTNLEGKIDYNLETVEEGKHYRLTVSNAVESGEYHGRINLHTDHPHKPVVNIRVSGQIEGLIAVRPSVLFVGRLGPNRPLVTGKIQVVHNQGESFEITRMDYDEKLIEVTKSRSGELAGYNLEIVPLVDRMEKTNLKRTTLTIQTDVEEASEREVTVQIVNR